MICLFCIFCVLNIFCMLLSVSICLQFLFVKAGNLHFTNMIILNITFPWKSNYGKVLIFVKATWIGTTLTSLRSSKSSSTCHAIHHLANLSDSENFQSSTSKSSLIWPPCSALWNIFHLYRQNFNKYKVFLAKKKTSDRQSLGQLNSTLNPTPSPSHRQSATTYNSLKIASIFKRNFYILYLR